MKNESTLGTLHVRSTPSVCLVVLCAILSGLFQVRAEAPRGPSLKGASPRFWGLLDHTAKLEVLESGFGFTERSQFGIPQDLSTSVTKKRTNLSRVSRRFKAGIPFFRRPRRNTYDAQHRLVDCASVLRAIIQIDRHGKYQILADRYNGQTF